MSIRALTTCCFAIALLFPGSATRLDAQGREREKAEARLQELRQRANQTEEKLAKYMAQRKEINAALENTNSNEKPDRFDQLIANRKELDVAIANIRNQFAAARERNQEGERSRQRDRDRAQKEGQSRANQIERKLKQHLGQLNEINAWLERNQGEEFAGKREQLMGRRKELMAAVEKIKAESAGRRERIQERERDQRLERKRQRDVHPEMRSAVNSLEHLEHAHGHLMEAGMTEIAHVVEQRMNNFRKKIEGYQQNPKQGAKDRPRKKEQPRSKEGLKRLKQLQDEVAELEAALDKRLGQLRELKQKIDR